MRRICALFHACEAASTAVCAQTIICPVARMNKQQLASRIWESAKKMRSKIPANEYKDFILGFIFYKFLSDGEVSFLKKNGMTDPELTALSEKDSESVRFCQDNIGYFIAYENLFSTWLEKDKVKTFDVSNVHDALMSFGRLIGKNYKQAFEGIFDSLSIGLQKLGDTAAAQTKAIAGLMNLIRVIPMDGRQDYDVLGFIYEYLISNFAASAGKKAGESYTPHEVSVMMSEIIAAHLKQAKNIEIYDPTSGSGSLLINIGRSVSRFVSGENKIKYYAQELKSDTYNLTRMNLVMRGISPANLDTRNADTLEEDWPVTDSLKPLRVDAVVSNPPYSQKWDPDEAKKLDPRFSYGMAPKSKADYAFLLHDLYHLKPNGIMTIVLPHGVLFRGKENDNSEWTIRRNLIENNNIDAIIGLPPNIFFGTGIPTLVMVLKKSKPDDRVLFVDASLGFEKAGQKNRLRSSDIRRIVDAVSGRIEMPGFSKLVDRDEIRANGYNLNIPRYIRRNTIEHWDISSVMFGGIPNSELNGLSEYWNVLDTLWKTLFSTKGNYSRVKVKDIGKAIAEDSSVAIYSKSVKDALSGFDKALKKELVDGWESVRINTEEMKLASEVFKRFGKIQLIDKYDAYQILDNEWTKIETDLEILQSEGFDAVRALDPHMVIKKVDGDDEEVQEGWQGRIIPFELVQRRFFGAELAEIESKVAEAERIHAVISAMAAEIPEEEKEDVIEEGSEDLDSKLVASKAGEVLGEVETEEIKVLRQYLLIASAKGKKSFQSKHAEVAWGEMTIYKSGVFSKSVVQTYIAKLQENFVFPDDSFEALIVRAHKLFNDEKRIKSEVRSLKASLEEMTIKKYGKPSEGESGKLSDEEAKELLEVKWVRPIIEKLSSMPLAVVESLASKVKALASKYETTLSDVQAKIETAESDLAGMLDELQGNADDMSGIGAWKKELAK